MNVMEQSFAVIEQRMWSCCKETFRQAMSETLVAMDDKIYLRTSAGRYRVLGTEQRVIETLVGPVEVRRRCYWDQEQGKRVYLLDEQLKLPPNIRIGPGLSELVASLSAMGPSYRAAREQIAKLLGERMISHEGIRQVVLWYGERIEQSQGGIEKRQVPVLYIEADGAWFNHRGKSRKQEAKIIVVHEGWQPRYEGSKEYELVRRQRKLVHGRTDQVWGKVRRRLMQYYDGLDETLVVIGGDGASWIRKGVDYFGTAMYQFDRFHITRQLRETMGNDSGEALAALRDNDMTGVIEAVRKVRDNSAGNKRYKLNVLLELVEKDQEQIIDYRLRCIPAGYDVSTWRGLGSVESNVGKLKARLRGRVWSRRSFDGISNVIIAFTEGKLGLYGSAVSMQSAVSVAAVVSYGVGEVLKQQNFGELPPVRRGQMPALAGARTGTSQALRSIVNGGMPV